MINILCCPGSEASHQYRLLEILLSELCPVHVGVLLRDFICH